MIKITVNKRTYFCPASPAEATLDFYERVYIALPLAQTAEEQCAALIGCGVDEVSDADGALSNKLLDYYSSTSQWLGAWADSLKKADAKPATIGGTAYALPKNWVRHQFRAHILLNDWLTKGQRSTLVSDVISLYLAPSVFGDNWTDEDKEELRKELLNCKAVDVAPLFFYALGKPRDSAGRWQRLIFRLTHWTLQRRINLG